MDADQIRLASRIVSSLMRRYGARGEDARAAGMLGCVSAIRAHDGKGELASLMWLKARSEIVGLYRQRQRQRDVLTFTGDLDLPPVPASQEETLLDRERAEAVERAKAKLCTRQRAAIESYLQGATAREMGEIVGTSEANARLLKHRAVQRLRAELEHAS